MASHDSVTVNFVARIETADLLSHCGQQCLSSSDVSRLESLDRALEIIAGSQLDPVADSNWDKSRIDALRACRRILKARKKWWNSFRLTSELDAQKRRVEKIVAQRFTHSAFAKALAAKERSLLASHFVELFDVAVSILDTNLAPKWPHILTAANLALEGYLPIDFVYDGQSQRVLIY